MNKSKLRDKLIQENQKIDISMSDKLKNMPINTSITEKKKTNNWLKIFVPIATFACVAALIAIVLLPTTTIHLTAYVVEINPSIAFIADSNDNIINICSVNEDADEILASEAFSDISKMKLSEAIEKTIEITINEGYLDSYEGTIKIYALNDNEKELDKKLDRFADMFQKSLNDFGHNDINFEKKPMMLDDFRDKMGFEKDFRNLDDMKDDIKNHDRYKMPPPPKPGDVPPKPID